ncbi:MAG: GNAT family N-acetyltransferase [Cyanobacteriota bacterium]|nr:GNAT family N-acetyltransferase [Cyanobacteriota bacterium]
MLIRPAQSSDVAAILDIYNEAVLNTTASYEYQPRSFALQMDWFAEHKESGYPIIVAENTETQILGWGSLSRYHSRWGYRFTVEDSIYVAVGSRGQGIGKMLLGRLITSAQERQFHTIVAAIDAANMVSRKLHEKFGFIQVGCLREVGYKFDRWLDVAYMQLLL